MVVMYDLMYCWIWLAKILLRILSLCWSGILVYSFLHDILVCFQYQSNTDHKAWLEAFLSHFGGEEFEKDIFAHLWKFGVRLSSIICCDSKFFGKLFDYCFNFLSCICPVQLIFLLLFVWFIFGGFYMYTLKNFLFFFFPNMLCIGI